MSSPRTCIPNQLHSFVDHRIQRECKLNLNEAGSILRRVVFSLVEPQDFAAPTGKRKNEDQPE
jgi:hypothetical protein